MIYWLALVVATICSTGGNMLANWSHACAGNRRWLVLIAAMGVYGFGLLCFSVALTGIPLVISYPVLIGGSVACVSLLAVALFGERLSARHLAGLVLIMGGMLLLQGRFDLPPMLDGQVGHGAVAGESRSAVLHRFRSYSNSICS